MSGYIHGCTVVEFLKPIFSSLAHLLWSSDTIRACSCYSYFNYLASHKSSDSEWSVKFWEQLCSRQWLSRQLLLFEQKHESESCLNLSTGHLRTVPCIRFAYLFWYYLQSILAVKLILDNVLLHDQAKYVYFAYKFLCHIISDGCNFKYYK